MRCPHGFEEDQCARCTALKAMTAAQNAAREAASLKVAALEARKAVKAADDAAKNARKADRAAKAAEKAKAAKNAADLLANEQFQKDAAADLAQMDAACSLAA